MVDWSEFTLHCYPERRDRWTVNLEMDNLCQVRLIFHADMSWRVENPYYPL